MWLKSSTYQILFVLLILQTDVAISLSDKRLCADPECKTVISQGRAKIHYSGGEDGRVSFKIKSNIRIMSKSAGSDPSLWGIEVNGRKGYAPKEYILEDKIFVKEKDLIHEVAVENVKSAQKQEIEAMAAVNIKPSETIVENQVAATEKPASEPLQSATEATPSLIQDSSANEVELPTAPLAIENKEIVNQSLKDVVTPVANSFEVIDGTAIPIVEGKATITNTENEQLQPETITANNIDVPKVTNEEALALKSENVSENEIGTEAKLNQNVETASSVNESMMNINNQLTPQKENPIPFEKTPEEVVPKTIVQPETTIPTNPITVDNIVNINNDGLSNEKPVNLINSEKASLQTPEIVENAKTEDNKQSNVQTETLPSLEQAAPNLNQKEQVSNESGPVRHPLLFEDDEEDDDEFEDDDDDVDEDDEEEDDTETFVDLPPTNDTKTPNSTALENQTMPAGNSFEKKEQIEVTTTQSSINVPETPKPSATKESETKAEAIVANNMHNTMTAANAIGTNENIGATTFKQQEVPTQSPIIDAQIPKTDFVDLPSKIEEVDTTHTAQAATATADAIEQHQKVLNVENNEASTLKPQIPVEIPKYPKTEFSGTQTDSAGIEKNNMQTQIPTNIEVNKEDQEKPNIESTTSNPQVPSMPMTLPIFQQPLVQPVHQEIHNAQNTVYENPNDYYREQALREQPKDSLSAEHMEKQSSNSNQETMDVSSLSEENPSHDAGNNTNENHSNENSFEENYKSSGEINSAEITVDATTPSVSFTPEPATDIPEYMIKEENPEGGLFTTILGTVNTLVNKLRKEPQKNSHDIGHENEGLHHLRYSVPLSASNEHQQGNQYCEKLSPQQCPQQQQQQQHTTGSSNEQCNCDWSNINMHNFAEIFLAKAFEMRELLSCLAITASASLLFLFGYYCFCNSSREGALISKLNQLERSLLASHKENAILKDDIMKTRNKLSSIEDNSFGSNDMVVALKKELEIITAEKSQLQEHVHSLEKELETAAEAGLELNKIVAELLNNQSGQESMIMNSVEDLQLQFNEQQKTILEINANLAEKSRENSELQMMLAEQNVRFNGQIASLQQDNDELEAEKANLQTRIEELKTEFDEDITKALEGKNVEIKRLQNEIIEIKNRFENIHTKWQTSLAKIEALEDCMKTMKRDPNVNITDVINVANVKAELLDLQQQRSALKSHLETEKEARHHAENTLKNIIIEVDRLKQDFHQSEKDKLEAQTRLEVLSNYFKEKETQLQKELSLKETIWLKQQGENTSTVDRMTAMQEEIQSLKSQNDALRAEIEAQIAAHKAQTGTLENRAHETWLAARQSERRYEESRAEAAALRRRLTELAGATNAGDAIRAPVDSNIMSADLTNAPSPILPPNLLDTAGSPLLGRLPPPQFMPFMGAPPPPPFLNLPPPPPPAFLSSVEMRPAPLGRMTSPPLGRYSPPPAQRDRNRSDYYDDDYDDDDDDYDVDDDDYDYEDDEDTPRHRRHPRRRRSGNGSDSWRRDDYSPPPPDRSYRSHSPADSRYNYTADRDINSTYETDLSPPASPNHRGGGIDGSGSRTKNYMYQPKSTEAAAGSKTSSKAVKKSAKGMPNSDSDKSTRQNKKGKSLV